MRGVRKCHIAAAAAPLWKCACSHTWPAHDVVVARVVLESVMLLLLLLLRLCGRAHALIHGLHMMWWWHAWC